MTKNEVQDELFGDLIDQYTRAEAIEDGVLIDVTQEAWEGRNPFPTALTATVWDTVCAVPTKRPLGKDEKRPAVEPFSGCFSTSSHWAAPEFRADRLPQ